MVILIDSKQETFFFDLKSDSVLFFICRMQISGFNKNKNGMKSQSKGTASNKPASLVQEGEIIRLTSLHFYRHPPPAAEIIWKIWTDRDLQQKI